MVELLASIVILSILLVILMGAVSSVSSLYLNSEKKVQAFEGGRAALELVTRELTPAVVDTRMQFVIVPGEHLTEKGAIHVAPNSPAMLWMAPLGTGGDLRSVGYYLTANPETKRYQLKRIYIRDDNPDGYFPRLVNLDDARDLTMRTDALSGKWFLENWDMDTFDDLSEDNDKVVVSTVSNRVIAFWIQPLDLLGNPIPWVANSPNHPSADLIYNSAAYFHMADGKNFDDGSSFVYLAKRPLVMKAHRLPPEIELAIVMVGDVVLNREVEIPEMENVFNEDGSLNLRSSLDAYLELLKQRGIRDAESFTTRVKLTNGG